MAENGFFGTAFRGFRKEDVLNYIDALNTAHCEETAALTQEAADLRKENESLQQKLPTLEKEVESLRVQTVKVTELSRALEDARQRLVAFEEEKRQLTEKLAVAENTAAQCTRLQNENTVLNEQLAAQQISLDTYEKMFGESRDAAAFVRNNVDACIQESRRRTERTLSEVEKMAARMTVELEELRSRTAAIRSETAAADEKDAAALSAWFQQFDKKVSRDTDTHFFR